MTGSTEKYTLVGTGQDLVVGVTVGVGVRVGGAIGVSVWLGVAGMEAVRVGASAGGETVGVRLAGVIETGNDKGGTRVAVSNTKSVEAGRGVCVAGRVKVGNGVTVVGTI